MRCIFCAFTTGQQQPAPRGYSIQNTALHLVWYTCEKGASCSLQVVLCKLFSHANQPMTNSHNTPTNLGPQAISLISRITYATHLHCLYFCSSTELNMYVLNFDSKRFTTLSHDNVIAATPATLKPVWYMSLVEPGDLSCKRRLHH